jgi:hypothetical protein
MLSDIYIDMITISKKFLIRNPQNQREEIEVGQYSIVCLNQYSKVSI